MIYNSKTVANKTYDILPFNDFYLSLIGEAEAKFVGMFYGESGGGKSVFALQFADWFADNVGKALVNSHEERLNKTLSDRIRNFKIDSTNLYFADRMPFDLMVKKIKSNYYRLVVIDSVQAMGFTSKQLKELVKIFSKRKLVVLMISFGKSKGNPTDAVDLLHDCDVKTFFKAGRVEFTSRYLDQPVSKTLYIPNRKNNTPTLF